MEKRRLWFFIPLAVLILLSAAANLLIGSVNIPVADVLRILAGNSADNEIWTNIIFKSRLPQTVIAVMAGAGLAVSGLLMQTVFRNPLADPSVLGVSSGASLGGLRSAHVGHLGPGSKPAGVYR